MNKPLLAALVFVVLLTACSRGAETPPSTSDTNATGTSTAEPEVPATAPAPGEVMGTGTGDGTTRPANPGAPIDEANRAPPQTSTH